MSVDVRAVMLVMLPSSTGGRAIPTQSAQAEGDAAHNAITLLKGAGGSDGGTDCYDSAGAFVGSRKRERDARYGAQADDGVGVTVGGDGDFDEKVVRPEGGWGGDGDGGLSVGGAEGGDAEGLHGFRKGWFGHFFGAGGGLLSFGS